MHVKVTVHSHDHLPEHEQVHFNTPEIPGGLMVLRLPKGHALPDIGSEYDAYFQKPQAAGESGSVTGGPVNTDPSDTSSAQLLEQTADLSQSSEADTAGPAGSDQGGA